MAELAPIPSARVSTATAVTPGFFCSWRKANFRSLISFFVGTLSRFWNDFEVSEPARRTGAHPESQLAFEPVVQKLDLQSGHIRTIHEGVHVLALDDQLQFDPRV